MARDGGHSDEEVARATENGPDGSSDQHVVNSWLSGLFSGLVGFGRPDDFEDSTGVAGSGDTGATPGRTCGRSLRHERTHTDAHAPNPGWPRPLLDWY